jgi:hypothetical protein
MDKVRYTIISAPDGSVRETLLLVCDALDRMAIASIETALELDQMDDDNESRNFVLGIENSLRAIIRAGLGL